MKNILILLIVLCHSQMLFAQNHDHDHHHEKIHIGFGVTESYLSGHGEFVPGIHLHLMKNLDHSGFWKIGLGYEYLSGDKKHHSLNLPIGMQVFDGFTFSIAPGLVFISEEGEKGTLLSGHLEALYEFELGAIHLGPLFGFGFNKHETHLGIGLHVGIGL